MINLNNLEPFEVLTIIIVSVVLLLILVVSISIMSSSSTIYEVEETVCKHSRGSYGNVILTDCENGMTYINPTMYKEIKVKK